MYVYLNGRVVPRAEARISVFDRGFLYGDGVFETLRVYGGAPFRFEDHAARLKRSAALIGLDPPVDAGGLRLALHETLEACGWDEAMVRITVSRGEGGAGLDPSGALRPTLLIAAHEFADCPEDYRRTGVRAIIARTRRTPREALDPAIKSLNFLNNIQARREALAAGAFEALMLNTEGALAEGAVSNVFFVRGGVLRTPSLECGILAGITRAVVLECARAGGMEVEEGVYGPEDLMGAEEAFITNSSLEVMPVGAVGDSTYGIGPVSGRLREAYIREVARYGAAYGS